DLLGNGKTSIHASGSYFYDPKLTLANALSGLRLVSLTLGNKHARGAGDTATNGSCWTDANRDGLVQRSELIGTPTSSSARFINGVLQPAGNIVAPSAQIRRTP